LLPGPHERWKLPVAEFIEECYRKRFGGDLRAIGARVDAVRLAGVDARSRIGNGPWVNANGITVATSLAELHARTGHPDAFVDERGQKINGMWMGSRTSNEHDILTGSTAAGTVLEGQTCADWTSASNDVNRRVGHSDGFGGGGSTTVTPTNNVISWNSAHTSAGCANTAPGGGAGRFYCFAR
jgi:hypothetical protein